MYTFLTNFCFVGVFKNMTSTFPAATFCLDAYLPQGQSGRGQPFSQPAFQSVSQSAYMEAMPGMR